jgi:hypothetical protein
MTTRSTLRALALMSLLVASGGPTAFAQSFDTCSPYLAAVRANVSTAVPIVPDVLLADWKTAVKCLKRDLEGLKGIAEATSLPQATRNQFLSSTGAIRAIISKLNKDDENAKTTASLDEFIKLFREKENLEAIIVLTFGVRSDNYQARSNSLLILANVIDNTTVCVPLDHLWDKNLGVLDKDQDYPIRGRANLLSVVSVVAPWAYKENFINIKTVKDSIFNSIDKADPTLKQTVDILNNIEARLGAQTNDTNKNINLPDELKRDCKTYGRRFAKPEELRY